MKLGALRKSLLDRSRTDGTTARDVDQLLEYALGLNRTQLLTYSDEDIAEETRAEVTALFERLDAGEPLAYITAHQEFYGYDFVVTPSVLIPRPETERLVERALEIFSEAMLSEEYARIEVYDVGTGSGAIILSLLSELRGRFNFAQLKKHSFTGVDISDSARAVAAFNSGRLGHDDLVRIVPGDLLSGLEEEPSDSQRKHRFFLLLSNPPYIADNEELDASVQNHEPAVALRGGPNGMELPERLLEEFWHKSGSFSSSCALIEIGHQQSHTVECVARRLGFEGVEFIEDFHGIRRVALIKR